jgi:hypothetical protein
MVGARAKRALRQGAALLASLAVVAGAAWLARRPVTARLDAGPLSSTTGPFVSSDPEPRAGGISYLGIAPFRNTSSDPIHVDGVRITQASANVHVLGYRQYSTDQFDGRFLTTYGTDEPTGDGIDFDHTPPLRLPYTIPPTPRRTASRWPRFG